MNRRRDQLIGTKEQLYVIEQKFNGIADGAMQQMNGKSYPPPFEQQGRTIIKIGANASKETSNIEDRIIEKEHQAHRT